MQTTIKLFGKRIKELRKNQGMTQEKLAEIMSVDCQTISRIETGYYFTSYENLEKLSNAFDVDIKELFNFEHLKPYNTVYSNIINRLDKMSETDLRKVAKFIREFI